MSAREPLWYCHECNAEMRPLMVPDPVCASCHGSFVEKMENPTDDPREFHRQGGPAFGGGEDLPLGLENFLLAFSGMGGPGAPGLRNSSRSPERPGSPRVTRTFEIRSGSGPTIRVASRTNDEDPDQPTMADFLQRRPSDAFGGGIAGPLMARYLMAMLGREHLNDLFARGMGDEIQPGRMGDYVFNQEALDQIISQLMEQSNASRPVPATEDIIEKLPREVLEAGSSTLEKDCAVCKEQFTLGTEDPDEQVVITLPCKHPFHEPCILPWLKSSGTCPVCRHALVPQPEHHGPPPAGSGNTRNAPSPGGLFQSLFGSYGAPSNGSASGGGSGGQSSSTDGNTRRRATSDTTRHSSTHVPGGWEEELD